MNKHELILKLVDELAKHDLHKASELIKKYGEIQAKELELEPITF